MATTYDPNKNTLMEATSLILEESSLAVIKNCNMPERWSEFQDTWMEGHVSGSEHVGCGINTLYLLGEMGKYAAINQVARATQSGHGTSMQEMVEFLNEKSQDRRLPQQRVMFSMNKLDLINYTYDAQGQRIIDVFETKKSIYNQYKLIFDNMPDNSCILIKYMRDPIELAQRGVNLTPGHTVALHKVNEPGGSKLYVVDPQQKQGPTRLKLDEWEQAGMTQTPWVPGIISDGSYRSLVITNFYRSFWFITSCPYNCNSLVNICNRLPSNIANMTQIELDNIKIVSKFLSKHRTNIITLRGGDGNHRYEDISDLLSDKYVINECKVKQKSNNSRKLKGSNGSRRRTRKLKGSNSSKN